MHSFFWLYLAINAPDFQLIPLGSNTFIYLAFNSRYGFLFKSKLILKLRLRHTHGNTLSDYPICWINITRISCQQSTIESDQQQDETEIADEQAGFRAGRRTRDHIVNIRNIIKKYRGHSNPLYLCFSYYI